MTDKKWPLCMGTGAVEGAKPKEAIRKTGAAGKSLGQIAPPSIS